MTSMTWSPAQKALTTPTIPAFMTQAMNTFGNVFGEVAEVVAETFGSVGLQLSTHDRTEEMLSPALDRDIGRHI